MSTKISDTPYLETPVPQKTTKEQMIYGAGETLQEKEQESREKKKRMLNE
jgi:hypothetical protein